MNRIKRAAALLLVLAMALSLTGCSLFDTRMARALQKISKSDNLHVDLLDDMVIQVKSGEQTLPFTIALTGGADLYFSPFQAKAELLLEWPGFQRRHLLYLEKSEGVLTIYNNVNGGEAWEKYNFATNSRDFKADGLKYVTQVADTFHQVETPDVTDGSLRYDGEVPGSAIRGFLDLYHVKERLEADYGVYLPDDLLSNLHSVPVSLWLNAQGELDLILLDPGPMLNDVLGRLLNQTRQASGLSQLPMNLTLDGNTIAIQLSGYDALTDLLIPEEAHAALADGPEFWK